MSGKNNAVAVVGLQWGDEGKGKVVDWLSQDAAHVARFQGGHNAGHSLLVGGQKTVLHLLPSGVLHAGAKCYIGNGVVVSPPDLLKEMDEARARGVALDGRLFVAQSAALILPYHVRADAARDAKNQIGTTGRGIGPAHEDKAGRRALRFYDVGTAHGKARLLKNVAFYNHILARHGDDGVDGEAVWDELQRQTDRLRPFLVDDIGERLHAARQRGDNILLEGAQGALLDIEQGTYPYATSAPCLAAAAAGGLGVELRPLVLGVLKSYCTRVGNGPFPTELAGDDAGEKLARLGQEFGATTGRARRCGWLDIPMLRHAARINGCQRFIVTKLDILDAFEEIHLCVAYELDGERLHLPPSDAARLARCKPVYEKMRGWAGKQTAAASDWRQLPRAAQDYLRRIEQLCGARVAAASVGAERSKTLTRADMFDA